MMGDGRSIDAMEGILRNGILETASKQPYNPNPSGVLGHHEKIVPNPSFRKCLIRALPTVLPIDHDKEGALDK
jgi:hypothetical protein